ncbi:transposase [Chromobacterium vaccinii]|nr:transposase [Chromobacterium vaccinii]
MSGKSSPSGQKVCHEKSKFTEEQIAFALRQAESGTTIAEVCRKMGISEATTGRKNTVAWVSANCAA